MAYPKKMLSPDGTAVLAKQEVHEADLLAQGYTHAPEEPKKPVVGETGGAPVPCANCAALQAEVEALKAQLAPKLLEDMRAGELLQYAKDKGYDIGDMKPQAGAVNILAAIRAVEAKG